MLENRQSTIGHQTLGVFYPRIGRDHALLPPSATLFNCHSQAACHVMVLAPVWFRPATDLVYGTRGSSGRTKRGAVKSNRACNMRQGSEKHIRRMYSGMDAV